MVVELAVVKCLPYELSEKKESSTEAIKKKKIVIFYPLIEITLNI